MFGYVYRAAKNMPKAGLSLIMGSINAHWMFDCIADLTSRQEPDVPYIWIDDVLYIIVNHEDWFQLANLTTSEARTALDVLKARNLVRVLDATEGRAPRKLISINWDVFAEYCKRADEIDYSLMTRKNRAQFEDYILTGEVGQSGIPVLVKESREVEELSDIAEEGVEDDATSAADRSGYVPSPLVPPFPLPHTPSSFPPLVPPSSEEEDPTRARAGTREAGPSPAPQAPPSRLGMFKGGVETRTAAAPASTSTPTSQAALRAKKRAEDRARKASTKVNVAEALASSGIPADDEVQVGDEGKKVLPPITELESLLVSVLKGSHKFPKMGARLSDDARGKLKLKVVSAGHTDPSPEDLWHTDPLYREWLEKDALLWYRETQLPLKTKYWDAEDHLVKLVCKLRNGGKGFYEYKARVEAERRALEVAQRERAQRDAEITALALRQQAEGISSVDAVPDLTDEEVDAMMREGLGEKEYAKWKAAQRR